MAFTRVDAKQRHFRRVPTAVLAILAVLAVVAAGCSSSGSKKAGHSKAAEQYYVSLGDSYATGYQVTDPSGSGANTTNGFAYQIPPLAKAKGYDFKLMNFGCGGATTTSILNSQGCPAPALGPGATPYDGMTQIAAAEAFLRQHKGHIGLITVSISGNDVTSCAKAADPISCVTTAVQSIKTNVTALVGRLRAAAPNVPIVGTTYPDVILAGYLTPAGKNLATLSVTAFKALINPALQASYASAGGKFVDVTAASGAYGPMTETTTLAPYGDIPVPVAKVCELSFMCQYQNIHATTPGYHLIAQLVVDTLPAKH